MTQYERPSVGHVTPRVRADDDMEQPVDALDEYKPAVAQSLPADLHARPLRRAASMPPLCASDGLPRPIADAAAPTNALTRHLGLRGPGLVLSVTCFASLGVFMFGYDQGVMSGILPHPHFRAYFHEPSAAQVGTMVAILEIGALVTSLLSGVAADRFGRKAVMAWGAVAFSLGGLVQTLATGYLSLIHI